MSRFLALVCFAACSHASAVQPETDARPAIPDAPALRPDAPAPDATTYANLCAAPRPSGAPVPDQPALPAGGCPMLADGYNTLPSGRQFRLVLPANLGADERLPVLFMWYWLKGSADDFYTKGSVQAAADQQRFIAILPVAKGATVFGLGLNTDWPFDITQSQARMDEELQFFDDMLACTEQQLHVNASCVSTIGVSAGALFTDQLAQARSNTLASFVSLSGGVNDTIIKPWTGAARALPGVVLWGGDGPPSMDGNKDLLGCIGLGMDFSVASRDLEQGMVAQNEFLIECRHNCGHVEPPLDTPPGMTKYAAMWDFVMNHPFWLPPGTSPYQQSGLPPGLPAWCAIGAGNSTPRSGGGCPPAENPCAF
jgi:S-formylglutathione hydrolase FrmB